MRSRSRRVRLPAYRDTWGAGKDSFLAMLWERLLLMRELLADDGCLYLHCDWRVSAYVRLVLDETFGRDHFSNEIVWHRSPSAPRNPERASVGAPAFGGRRSGSSRFIWRAGRLRVDPLARPKRS